MPTHANPAELAQSSSYRVQKATIADLSLLEKLDSIPAIFSVGKSSFPLSIQLFRWMGNM
jgi:hypothetical protein